MLFYVLALKLGQSQVDIIHLRCFEILDAMSLELIPIPEVFEKGESVVSSLSAITAYKSILSELRDAGFAFLKICSNSFFDII